MTHSAVEAKADRETMFREARAFSSFSSNDLAAAKEFYADTLGLDAMETSEGLRLIFGGAGSVFIYPKDDHTPASFTVLNLPVDDIDLAVDALASRGVKFESYGGEIKTDEKGVFRGSDSGRGPNIAWFKDPAGNILSVIEEKP